MNQDKQWRERLAEGSAFEVAVIESWKQTVDPTTVRTQVHVDVPVSRLPQDWLPGASPPGQPDPTEIPGPAPDTSRSGKRGRIDLLVHFDEDNEVFSLIGEIKHCDWDRIKSTNVRPYARGYVRQIWRYISAYQAEGKVVVPSVIFSRRPRDIERLLLIEKLFDDNMIAVVWADETLAERRARSSADMDYPHRGDQE